MNWHNFKVLSMYGIIVFVILLILGQVFLAIITLVGCPLYGFFDCIIQHQKEKKIKGKLEHVPDHIKDIVTCYIIKRHPNLKKKTIKTIEKDIINGDYKTNSFSLTDMLSVPGEEADSGCEYFLIFDKKHKYHVTQNTYYNAHIGDTLWIISTPTEEIKVIQSKLEFFNMFIF